MKRSGKVLSRLAYMVVVVVLGAFFAIPSPLSAAVNPLSLLLSGSFASNEPVSCTVTGADTAAGTLLYKFYYCANYGTAAYATSPWVVMRDYAADPTCTYTFPDDGSYVVVVRVVADPTHEPDALPIIGGVVTIGTTANVQITGLSVDTVGSATSSEPVTYTVTASHPGGSDIYYKWFYRADYGTAAYSDAPWVVVQDYSTATSCTYAFPKAGNYIVVVRAVTDPANEPDDISLIGASLAYGVVNNDRFVGLVEVPDPLADVNPTYDLTVPPVPAAGAAVADNDFGTTQTRVVATEGLRQEYSRFDPFNANQSRILFLEIAQGEWRVYNAQQAPYDNANNLVAALDVEEPRWDPINPDLLWGIQGFSLVTIDVASQQTTVVKDFSSDPTIGPIVAAQPDLYRITMNEEGESSTDKRYWAFLIQGSNEEYRCRYLFTWDRQLDQVLGLYTISAAESLIDWVGMSPRGTWVLIGGDWDNGGNFNGLVMADKALSSFHRLDYATAHADVGLDSNGNEVLVMQGVRTDYIDMLPLATTTTPISEHGGSYEGTNRIPLVRLSYSDAAYGLNSGVHISCNYPGYCVVSTYSEPNMAAQNWLDRKIILVKLDAANPRAFYLAKVYATRGAYWEETQATISSDGSRVVWATNWNQFVGEERVWSMQMNLP